MFISPVPVNLACEHLVVMSILQKKTKKTYATKSKCLRWMILLGMPPVGPPLLPQRGVPIAPLIAP